ncbi:MAG: hypothetical protein ACLR8Y_14300 [Alistipes indistinctus]
MARSIFIPGITLLTTLLCTLPAPAQTGGGSFLEIVPDAPSAGMGRTRTALPSKRHFCFPQSGPNSADGETGEVGYNIAPWLRDLGTGRIQHTVGGFYRLGDKQALSAGVRLLTLPSSDLTDDYGNLLRTTHPYDLSVSVGYSRTVARNLAVGATVEAYPFVAW